MIKIDITDGGWLRVYDVRIINQPVINETQYYTTIKDTGIEDPYSEVTISYFSTSVQRLYRINEENWQNYADRPIKLKIGDKIKAKSIDKDGNETSVTELEIKTKSDTLGIKAYRGTEAEYDTVTSGNEKRIYIDSSMIGQRIHIKVQMSAVSWGNQRGFIKYYKADGSEIESCRREHYYERAETIDEIMVIPEETKYIAFEYDKNRYNGRRLAKSI